MGKIKNELLLTIAVVGVLTLICVVTVWENSRKEYVYLEPRYDIYGNLIEELNYREIYSTNSKGKTLSYIVFNRPEDEEIAVKYQEFFDMDPYVFKDSKRYKDEIYKGLLEEYGDDKDELEKQESRLFNEHTMRWQKARELVYEDRVDCFLEENNCHAGDIVFRKGILDETIILYATSEEMDKYRTHSYVKKVDIYTN